MADITEFPIETVQTNLTASQLRDAVNKTQELDNRVTSLESIILNLKLDTTLQARLEGSG